MEGYAFVTKEPLLGPFVLALRVDVPGRKEQLWMGEEQDVEAALRGKERSADGMVDIMVRAEDASKINRIVERFKLATVDTVSIKRDIEQSKADKTASSAPEQEKPDKAADDRLLDDLLQKAGDSNGK